MLLIENGLKDTNDSLTVTISPSLKRPRDPTERVRTARLAR